MIIYGTKSTKLTVEPLTEECPHCHIRHTMDMHMFQRYAHVFWVPLFPVGKYGASQCNHCRQVLKKKQMPESLRLTYAQIKAQTTTPLWVWAGTIIIALIAVLVLIKG